MAMNPTPPWPHAPGWKAIFSAMRQQWSTPAHSAVNQRQKLLCALILMWENLAARLWPYGLAFFVFIAAALFDIPSALPGLLHSFILVALAVFFVLGAMEIWRHARWPSEAEIFHRIELSSLLEHRPLTSLEDRPAGFIDQPGADAWWRMHQNRIRNGLRNLRTGWPRFGFAPNDPWALRTILLLLMVIGFMHAGRDAGSRLWHALRPAVPPASSLLTDLTIWVKPPAYTQLPQMRLKPGSADIVKIPQGSDVFVQFSGVRLAPGFSINGVKQELNSLAEDSYQATVKIPDSASELRATVGWQSLGDWPVQIVMDTPPKIDWDGEVYATPRAALRIGYKAIDDYGLKSVIATITKPGEPGEIILRLPAFAKGGSEVTNSSYHDVAWHRWAGDAVELRLTATDAVGQSTVSPPQKIQLPQRVFQNPLAKLIADLRRKFIFGQLPAADLGSALEDILQKPGNFDYDPIVTLSLRVASTRTLADAADHPSIADLLWDTALRVEDKGVSLAERDLRSIEQALQDAIARGAGIDEINNLMDQFEAAMSKYMQSLFEQMDQQNLADIPPIDPNAQSIESGDIDRLMAQIRQLMQAGNTDEAQKLLAKLQEIMANMKSNQRQNAKANKLAMEIVRRAQGLIRDQQSALDETAEHISKPAPPSASPSWVASAQKSQKEIAKNLDILIKSLANAGAPHIAPYDRAGEHIAHLLKIANPKTNPNTASEQIVTHQTEALTQLRLGLQELMKAMQDGNSGGQMRAGGGRFDPFGRPRPGQGLLDDQSIKVPGVEELVRTREILDELQKRSGDYSRPDIERDYIKRLLRRF